MVRIIVTILCAFIVGLILGKVYIPMLHALKAGQSIREIGPKWHSSKNGTPTIGGIIFITAMLVCVFAGIGNQEGDYTHLLALAFALVFGAIGFIDDFFKVKYKRNLGLTALQKLALQLVASAVYLFVLAKMGNLTWDLYLPFANKTVYIAPVVYILFAVFVIVGCVNAVNLTDGIDGLATGVTMPVMLFFLIVSVTAGRMSLALFPACLLGGLGAFLCYNFHPAKVFMGDTGSLFLGAAVCGMAFALDMPLVLILVGLIYIIETVSVMMQVTYFKLTHGKRIFKMTPIHHHFEMCGWSEVKIFTVFVTVTVLMCALAWWGVSGRF